MKITDLDIEQFGIWRNLELPLGDSNLSVFYGPNEAGKTTLLRFIRGVLYGFQPDDFGSSGRVLRGLPKIGGMRVVHADTPYEIRRASQGNDGGLVTTVKLPGRHSSDDLLAELLSDVDQKLFEQVFAVGLHELQELATLQGEDVAAHIYQMTLGPDVERLLQFSKRIEDERFALLQPREQIGELAGLIQQQDQLAREIQELDGARTKHAEFLRQQERIEADIADLKRRQHGIESQLRGHVFLDRVWTPWNRVRRIRAELKSLPVVAGFPEDGLQRLDEIDDELATAVKCRDAVLAEARQLRRETQQLSVDAEIQRHAAAIRGFLDQRDGIEQQQRRAAEARERAAELRVQLDEQLQGLGLGWTLDRLETVITTPAVHFRLVNVARKYQTALTRRARIRRRHTNLSAACQKRLGELNMSLQQLGGLSLDETIASTRRKLTELEDLGRLRLRRTGLEQRRSSLHQQIERGEARPVLPKWVYGVLVLFAIAGLMLLIHGVMTSTMVNGLFGAIYALLGMTAAGLAWAFKKHFESDGTDDVEQLRDELRTIDVRMRETDAAVQRLGIFDAPQPQPDGSIVAETAAAGTGEARASQADLIRHLTQRLLELQSLSWRHQGTQALRRRLSGLRSRYQIVQRDVSTARQAWCEILTQFGFPETVRISEAFDVWQNVAEVNDLRVKWSAADSESGRLQRELASVRQRIQQLGHRMHRWEEDYDQPLAVLAAWEDQLRSYSQVRKRRQELRSAEKTRRSEAAGYRRIIDEVSTRRSALLVQGGATTRDEFEQRAQWAERRQELETSLAEVKAELESIGRTEPELAVVEEDLLAYDPQRNAKYAATLTEELKALEHDLHEVHEELGRLKQEIEVLENDRRSTELRFEFAQTNARLKHAAERWFAVEWASQAVRRVRSKIERECQPETLAAAARYFQRLSRGRYRNIWTPLAQQSLWVDDDQNNTLQVEHLSGGTREQLFLAIRLAMIERFARNGVEQPIVLDDVFVNFDQHRTEAAVEELINLSRRGQQVLFFTCHLHLARMFEDRGYEPIWLPHHQRLAEGRLAG